MKILLLTLLLAAAALAQAEPAPTLIPFQGRLTDQTGTIYTVGEYTLIFNLYDQAVGGRVLWTETHQRVGVINGIVNVFLGSINPALTGVDFSQTRYLGITIDPDNNPNTPDPEMVPRQIIIPAFWAKNSEKLNGSDWTPIFGVNSPNGPIPGAKIRAASISSAQLAPDSVTSTILAANSVGARHLQPSSISGSAIVDFSIPFAKRVRRGLGNSGRPLGDVATSAVINTGPRTLTTTWEAIPNSSSSLNTIGSPVMVLLTSAEDPSSGNHGYVSIKDPNGGFVTAYFGLFVDGVLISSQKVSVNVGNLSGYLYEFPPSLQFLIPGTPGEHTFEIRVRRDNEDARADNQISIVNSKLVVLEL